MIWKTAWHKICPTISEKPEPAASVAILPIFDQVLDDRRFRQR